MKGIDISSHNGNINFEAVKNSGVEVVIIKATEGVDFIDRMVNQHYIGAKNAGLNIGFYHFMSEKTDPCRQAEDFYNCIKDKSYNVLPCLDIEVNNYGRSATEITNRCLEFINRFKELSGQDCMIYTGGYFGRDNLDSRIKCYPGWIAHYGVSQPMETGFPVVGHQYKETGRVNGVNGNVDMNNFNESILLGNAVIVNNVTSQPIGGNNIISLGQQHANNFAGCGLNPDGIRGKLTRKGAVKVLQHAMNLDYNAGLSEDGVFGSLSSNALSGHTVRQGETQYMVTALEILLMLKGYDPNGVECPGIFGSELSKAVGKYQDENGLDSDNIAGFYTFKSLIS